MCSASFESGAASSAAGSWREWCAAFCWPGDVILGDDDGVVVLPAQLAGEIYEDCVRHDEVEQAILEHTQREGISPKAFYPFNSETEKIYEEWKARR